MTLAAIHEARTSGKDYAELLRQVAWCSPEDVVPTILITLGTAKRDYRGDEQGLLWFAEAFMGEPS